MRGTGHLLNRFVELQRCEWQMSNCGNRGFEAEPQYYLHLPVIQSCCVGEIDLEGWYHSRQCLQRNGVDAFRKEPHYHFRCRTFAVNDRGFAGR